MHIDFSNISASQRYFAMVQAIVPRPIAWVLSDNGDDSYNVAPYSFFTGVCSEPPILMISAGKKDAATEKDTRLNIRTREYFVVHIPGTKHLEQVNKTAETLAHGISEVDTAQLQLESIEGFALPRIVGCGIAMACKLHRMDEIGAAQSVIYGEILMMTVSDDLITPSEQGRLVIDAEKLDPLSRLGGDQYSALGERMSIARPK